MSGSLSDYRPLLSEVTSIHEMLKQSFKGKLFLAGSSWRKRDLPTDERVGDIDLVLVESDADERTINDKLFSALFGRHKNGNVKTKGVIGRTQVDFFRTKREAWGATLLFYRLPRQLQLAARAIAAARGMRFGPNGIFDKLGDNDVLIRTQSMADAYEILGIAQFSPEDLMRGADYVFSEPLNK